jgi:hypothetical protein
MRNNIEGKVVVVTGASSAASLRAGSNRCPRCTPRRSLAPGDKTNAELFAQRKLGIFGLAHPHGMWSWSAHGWTGWARRMFWALASDKPKCLTLPSRDKLFDGARHVFYRNRRIDLVLMRRSTWSVRRGFSDAPTTLRICSGRLSSPTMWPFSSILKPNFVQTKTWSRTGSSASPTNSSLTNGHKP